MPRLYVFILAVKRPLLNTASLMDLHKGQLPCSPRLAGGLAQYGMLIHGKTLLSIFRRYPLAGSYCIHGHERRDNILLPTPINIHRKKYGLKHKRSEGVFGLCRQVSSSEDGKYDNYTLLRLYPTNNDQMGALAEFSDPQGQVEVLKGSRGYNDSMDVLVPSARMGFMENFVRRSSVRMDMTENYGRLFEMPQQRTSRRMTRPVSVDEYNSYEGIVTYLEALARRLPDMVTLDDVGESYQRRPMKLVKLSTNPRANNPVIFVDAGIHAREWVAPAMALYLIHRLANDPAALRNELNGVDWYILPVVNPDGYEYSRSSPNNRMWRKTRSKNGICYGVDGNRNYAYKWAVSGVSSNPCDRETYAGPKAFSERETQIVRNIMLDYAKRIKLYVSLHAYGQYLVYPWGYTDGLLPPTWKKLDSLARAVSDSVQRAGGRPFKVLSAGQWYPAAGGSDDFAFGAVGVPYSYTMELTNGHEFVFPENLLNRVLPQFYEGFKTFAAHIKSEFGAGRRRNPKL